MILEIQAERNRVESFEVVDSARVHDALREDWETAASAFQRDRGAIIDEIDSLLTKLDSKLSKLFESISPVGSSKAVSENSIAVMEQLTEQHNELCNNDVKEKRSARQRLELHYVAQRRSQFTRLQSRILIARAASKKRVQDLSQSKQRIENLESKLIEHRRPASELNADLAAYLGHNELNFEVRDTGLLCESGRKPGCRPQ